MPHTNQLLLFLNAAVLSRKGQARHHWLWVRHRAVGLLMAAHDPEGLSRRILRVLSQPLGQSQAA